MTRLIHTYAVIMAGGGGTRLWPVSRKERPKQLLPLLEEQTLFQSTVTRLEKLFPPERILVVTVAEQASIMQGQAPEIPIENYLIEPAPRGTASVVGLAAAVLMQRDPKALMAVLPSDHFIRHRDLFHYLLRAAFDVAEKGYFQQGEALDGEYKYPVYAVKRFIEKPDEQTAQQLLRNGNHSWNSGMFIWQVVDILNEIKRQMPALSDAVTKISASWCTPQKDEVLSALWYDLKVETVDYGVMENAELVAVLPASGLGWSDVGSWDSLAEVLLPDMNGNIAQNAHHLAIDTHNSLVYSNDNERLVSLLA
jgi:mannose-1-phosphate guanylyltransferase